MPGPIQLVSDNKDLFIDIATNVGKTAATTQVALILYDKYLGPSYSEKDIDKLKELKKIYSDSLHIEPPVFWELDKNNCPTHKIEYQHWLRYMKQLKNNNDQKRHYSYQANLIGNYAATYLTKRGKRRFGSGRIGDLLEQFISEWINFALNELPNYEYNDISIAKLKQRIEYIENIRKHPNLFHFGNISRSRNKFETLNEIQKQLQSCIQHAIAQQTRLCARDKLNLGLNKCRELLVESTQVLYYARATDVHLEPLNVEYFINPNLDLINESTKLLYKKIKNTHTGSMLEEIINLVGLTAFGIQNPNFIPLVEGKYFDSQSRTKIIKWEKRYDDLPRWIMHDDIQEELGKLQQYGHHILRLKDIINLISTAYDLSGEEGNRWAYGDAEGRQSLALFLEILRRELIILENHFNVTYESHNAQRLNYNLVNKIEAASDANPNFNEIDTLKGSIHKLCSQLKNIIEDITLQMERYPLDKHKDITEKKRVFYKNLTNFVNKFHPEKLKDVTFGMFEFDSANHSRIPNEPSTEQNVLKQEFKLPIYHHPKCNTYLYYSSPQFERYVKRNPHPNNFQQAQTWKLGKSYDRWVDGFFLIYRKEFIHYQLQADMLEAQLKCGVRVGDIKQSVSHFQEVINDIQQRIESERPKWRFKLGLWPIKTKGWPFNRLANSFADDLLKEINLVQSQLQPAVLQAELRIQNSYLNRVLEETPNVEMKAQMNVAIQDDEIATFRQNNVNARLRMNELVTQHRNRQALRQKNTPPTQSIAEIWEETLLPNNNYVIPILPRR